MLAGAISAIFATLRILGFKSAAYQAFSHLYTGMLFGAWVGSNYKAKGSLILATMLCLVELLVFLYSNGFLHIN